MSVVNHSKVDNLHRLVHDKLPTFEFCNSSGCNIPDNRSYRLAFDAYQANYLSQVESEGGQPGEPLVGHLPKLSTFLPSASAPSASASSKLSAAPSSKLSAAPSASSKLSYSASASVSAASSDFIKFVPSSEVLSSLTSSEFDLFYKFPNKSEVLSVMRSWLLVMNKNEELERLGESLLSADHSVVNSGGSSIRLCDIPMKLYVVEKLLSCDVPGDRSFPLISGARL